MPGCREREIEGPLPLSTTLVNSFGSGSAASSSSSKVETDILKMLGASAVGVSENPVF